MRTYEIKRVKHCVYEDLLELPEDIKYLSDWRLAEVGDWVLADDGFIIQILRKNFLNGSRLRNRSVTVGTCTGTFSVRKTTLMDTERRKNIYSISGKAAQQSSKDRKRINSNEILFAQNLARGLSPEDAYIKVYRTNNRQYAKEHAAVLVKTERIQRKMKETLKPILEELGISPQLILSNIRDIALNDEAKDSDRLKALFELGEVIELKETNKVTEVAGALFQGFQPQQLESVDRPKLKEAKNA